MQPPRGMHGGSFAYVAADVYRDARHARASEATSGWQRVRELEPHTTIVVTLEQGKRTPRFAHRIGS